MSNNVAIAIYLSSIDFEMRLLRSSRAESFELPGSYAYCRLLRGRFSSILSIMYLSISRSKVFWNNEDRLIRLYGFEVRSTTLPTLGG